MFGGRAWLFDSGRLASVTLGPTPRLTGRRLVFSPFLRPRVEVRAHVPQVRPAGPRAEV